MVKQKNNSYVDGWYLFKIVNEYFCVYQILSVKHLTVYVRNISERLVCLIITSPHSSGITGF